MLSFDRQGNAFGQRNASHSRTRRLAHESLEARVVLSGSPAACVVPLNDGGDAAAETVLVANSVVASEAASQNAVSLDRFASAEDVKQYLIEDAQERWGHLFGKQVSDIVCFDMESLSLSGDADFSETNVQVPDMDEPDRVETDGRYLYSLSYHDLVIREIGDDAQPTIVARLALRGYSQGMFLAGDRLIVLADDNNFRIQTRVTILDVSDPASPSVLEETLVDGTYTDARAVGDKVYLVSRSDFFLPKPLVKGELDTTTFEPRFYETKDEYLARVGDRILDLVLPAITTLDGDGETVDSGWLVEPTEIYRPHSDEQSQLSNVVVFDLNDEELGPVDAMVGVSYGAAEIYLSDDGLFVLGSQLPQWGDWWGGWTIQPAGGSNETSILKFSVDEASGKLALAAVGSVPGRLLDQFSFDTHDGYLRIATTEGSGSEMTSGLYVLQQSDETLEIVGRIDDIAPGEQIYSARFLGDQAYLVTFEKVDPLHAIDLSDPTSPEIVGELKIPGFSNYLQDIGDGFLLALGRDASSETGLYADPQVSLFDVSDLSNPQLAARYTIPVGRDGGLNLFDDHHTVAYLPEYGILTLIAPTPDESAGDGLWVFKIDTSQAAIDDGRAIEYLATIDHDDGYVNRAVRMGDKLVVSSDRGVTVHDLASPEPVLGRDEIRSICFGDSQFRQTSIPCLEDGDYLFRLDAHTTGFLTFDGLFERSDQSDATFTLYDWQMNELAVSESDYPWAQARLDWQAKAGERFFLKVSGTATDVELRILNAVSIEGEYSDSLLRITSPTWDGDVNFEIYWHGNTGRPWKHEISGQAATRRLSLDVAGVHYDIEMYTPKVVIEGSGQNALTVDVANITTGLLDRGDIIADLGDGSGTISCSGPIFGITGEGDEIGFEVTIRDFREITVNGGDVAKLRGTEGDDIFTARPGAATMELRAGHVKDWLHAYGNEPERLVRVNDFREVHAYSAPGQHDTAKFYDTPGNDRFVATPDYAKIRGREYFARAKGFRYTHAYAKAGGDDTAKMKDSSGQDVCIADSEYVRMKGDSYSNRAKFFEQVDIRARGGTGDLALLRDAVLTSRPASHVELDDLSAAVLFNGVDHFKMRGKASDERADTTTIDHLLAYWPQ